MVENAIILDEKKHQDDESRRKSFSDQRKRIYLVNNIFEVWENANIELPGKNVVVTVISPRFVVSGYRGSRAVASSIIGGLADIRIYVFTHHKNNRFQKKLIVQNTNI